MAGFDYPEPDLPDTWEPIEYLCYRRDGSKAYRSLASDANLHIVKLASDAWNVNGEKPDGDVGINETTYRYDVAVGMAENFMSHYD